MNNISLLRGLYSNMEINTSSSGNVKPKTFEQFKANFDSFVKSENFEENDYVNFLKNNNIDDTKENLDSLKDCVDYINQNDDYDIEKAAENADEEDIDISKLEVDKAADIIKNYKNYVKPENSEEYDADTEKYDKNIELSEEASGIGKYAEAENRAASVFEEYAQEHPEIYSNLYKYKIVKALISNGMAVTDYNISLIENAGEKLNDVMKNFSSENAIEAIKSGEISIESLYKSKYINAKCSKKTDSGKWESLEDEIKKLFERENIEDTSENRNTARLFINEEIPLTKKNIEIFDMLSNNKLDDDITIENMAKAVSDNKKPEKTDIFADEADNELIEKYRYNSNILSDVKTAHLQYMYEKNVPYTIDNIARSAENGEVSENLPSENALEAKIKLTEIRLKLTKEASVRLAGKGIDINTKPLEKALNDLKSIEKDIYSEKLQLMDAEPSKENLQTMAKVFDVLNTFTTARQNDIDVTYSYRNGKVLDTLEALSTSVNQKLGDSFSNVSPQFEGLLESLEIEASKENISAAKILSKNGIEVNYENITEIKAMNVKISTLSEALSPYAVAEMIRDGVNPLESSIDDMLEYVSNFDKKYYQSDIEKTAQYIADINADSEYSDEEKTAVTAFYRALSTASKYGFASIGNSLGTRKLTVGELMDGTKSFEKMKRSNIDFKVDDETQLKKYESQIKTDVNNAVENSENTASNDFYDALVKSIISSGNPYALKEITKDGTFSQKTLEEIAAGLSEAEAPFYVSETKMQNLKEKITQMRNIKNDVISWLRENNVPLTLNNIANMAQFLSDSQTAGRKLDKLNKDLKEKNISSISDIKKIEENEPYEISEGVIDMTDEVLNDVIQSEESINILYKQIEGVKNAFELQKSINENSGNIFQIPYKKENGDITSLNMYVSGRIGENFSAFINLEAMNLGKVQAYVNFGQDGIEMRVVSQNAEYFESLKAEFEDEFSEFNIKKISFETGEGDDIFRMGEG